MPRTPEDFLFVCCPAVLQQQLHSVAWFKLCLLCRRVTVSAVQPADEDATTRQYLAQAYCGNVREGGLHAHNHHRSPFEGDHLFFTVFRIIDLGRLDPDPDPERQKDPRK